MEALAAWVFEMLVGVCALIYIAGAGTYASNIGIGVNYGRLGNDLPSSEQVVQLYQTKGITKMRVFDPEPSVLEALRNSNIVLTLGIRNEDLASMAASSDATNSWFATNVEPYFSDIVLSSIVVGNEVVPGPLAHFVLPVMRNLQAILSAKHLSGISITTSVPMSVLATSYPPSQSSFSDESMDAMRGIVEFLSAQSSPLLVNLYPYFAYASDPVNVRLDYALFNATDVVVQDGGLGYTNMMDAMVDAFFWAMEKVGVTDVDVAVSESGWPSDGNGDFTSLSLAAAYNHNFVSRIMSHKGTPKRPDTYIEGFVFAIFNENLKPDGVEQHFGLFFPNMQPVYPLFPLSA